MPLYAYKCHTCDSEFEVRQSFHDDALTVCKVCETEGSVQRIIQAAGIVFKGSGFYVTDNRSSNRSSVNSSSTATDKPASSETSTSSSDSKKDSSAASATSAAS